MNSGFLGKLSFVMLTQVCNKDPYLLYIIKISILSICEFSRHYKNYLGRGFLGKSYISFYVSCLSHLLAFHSQLPSLLPSPCPLNHLWEQPDLCALNVEQLSSPQTCSQSVSAKSIVCSAQHKVFQLDRTHPS